jgi:hypothetical protein
MRCATTFLTVLAVAIPVWLGAQAARPTSSAPEIFSATAQAKTAKGSASGMLEVHMNRYTPDFDRKTVEEALRLGGYPRFLTALRNAPEVGQLTLAGGPPYPIRYARETVDGGTRTIVIVTDRPVYFVGSARSDAKPRAGFEVAVVRMQVDGTGKGRGTMAAAARVRPDGNGGVLLDDYADELIAVSGVTRKPGG